MLKDDKGNWVTDQDHLKSMAVSFFGNLYMEDIDSLPMYPLSCMFPNVDATDLTKLEAQFSVEEIRKALFDMKPWKAPGFDGILVSLMGEVLIKR